MADDISSVCRLSPTQVGLQFRQISALCCFKLLYVAICNKHQPFKRVTVTVARKHIIHYHGIES